MSEDQAWRQRPPYRIGEGEEFTVRYRGNCQCGLVQYQIQAEEPLDVKVCHCGGCQLLHAAPAQTAAIFHKKDINFTDGHDNLEWYNGPEQVYGHRLPCKVRCSYCHCPIMDEGRNMLLLFPGLINFQSEEEKTKFRPRYHIFYESRALDIPDGLPKWSGINEDSELIADSPPELMRKYSKKRHGN